MWHDSSNFAMCELFRQIMFTKHNKEGWEASGKILRSSNIDTLYGTLFAYSIYTSFFKK